ncbi:MAG: ferritin-like domain-containing protein [Oscillospiraceae bacterium]|nr:ferritin-like domain-containing protein [Oscillospiraceae bacterium]
MLDQKREQAVWQRVMDLSAQAPACCKIAKTEAVTAEQIMELLCSELSDAATYEALSCRVCGQARQMLLKLAMEERQHAGKLETVYYLMTGKKPCPDRPKRPCIACTTEELRERYIQEVKGAERYKALAEKAGSFSKVFRELACEEEHHAQKVLTVLQSCL